MAEFGKNATQIMIFFPHYMWAEYDKGLAGTSVRPEQYPKTIFTQDQDIQIWTRFGLIKKLQMCSTTVITIT